MIAFRFENPNLQKNFYKYFTTSYEQYFYDINSNEETYKYMILEKCTINHFY